MPTAETGPLDGGSSGRKVRRKERRRGWRAGGQKRSIQNRCRPPLRPNRPRGPSPLRRCCGVEPAATLLPDGLPNLILGSDEDRSLARLQHHILIRIDLGFGNDEKGIEIWAVSACSRGPEYFAVSKWASRTRRGSFDATAAETVRRVRSAADTR